LFTLFIFCSHHHRSVRETIPSILSKGDFSKLQPRDNPYVLRVIAWVDGVENVVYGKCRLIDLNEMDIFPNTLSEIGVIFKYVGGEERIAEVS
jgi:DNA polymerase III delta prime subunit